MSVSGPGPATVPIARFAVLCFTILASASSGSFALPTTSVLIENLVGIDTPTEFALVEADGTTALTAGTPIDGDGAIVVLGYFSDATSAPVFTGEWTPLTGPKSKNTDIPTTTIGDTGSNVSGAFGFFTAVVNFDQVNPNTSSDVPDPGARLALAVYNAPTIENSTHFNIVTNDAWRWKAPTLLPDFVSINLNDAETLWFGGETSARRTDQPMAAFPGTEPGAQLVNISTRGYVGTGDSLLISGFVLQGTGTTRVLIRAVGPTLSDFSVSGAMNDPFLRILRAADGNEIASNDNWSDQANAPDIEAAFATTGAFSLPAGSGDAAILLDLDPASGGYTAQISGVENTTGVVIAEVYTVDNASPSARLVNISTRGFVGTGDSLIIPGFAVGSGASQRLLIRAVGPTLGESPFNLSGVLPDPILQIFSSPGNTLVAENSSWEDAGQGAAIAAAAEAAGAFALSSGSSDAALIFETPADSGYTVQISSASGQTGVVIAEVYEPP